MINIFSIFRAKFKDFGLHLALSARVGRKSLWLVVFDTLRRKSRGRSGSEGAIPPVFAPGYEVRQILRKNWALLAHWAIARPDTVRLHYKSASHWIWRHRRVTLPFQGPGAADPSIRTAGNDQSPRTLQEVHMDMRGA